VSGLLNDTELHAFVKLKSAPNSKDIFGVQNKIQTAQTQKGYCSMCKLSKIWAQQKFHLKPRWVKCAGDHLTNQCHRKERPSDVRCVLCGGNHSVNYKGCTVYKDLQKKTHPPLRLKQYTPPHTSNKPIHSTRSNTQVYAQVTKQISCSLTNVEQESHANQPHQQTSEIKDYDEKTFW
jgi:hypothetical protein